MALQTLSIRPAGTLGLQRRQNAFAARPMKAARPFQSRARQSLAVTASRDGGSGFWSGLFVGGALFGTLAYVFAPQISKALLGEDQKLRLPRFLEDQDVDPEVSKQNLSDQIAQLNSTIDTIQQSLNTTTTSMDKDEVNA